MFTYVSDLTKQKVSLVAEGAVYYSDLVPDSAQLTATVTDEATGQVTPDALVSFSLHLPDGMPVTQGVYFTTSTADLRSSARTNADGVASALVAVDEHLPVEARDQEFLVARATLGDGTKAEAQLSVGKILELSKPEVFGEQGEGLPEEFDETQGAKNGQPINRAPDGEPQSWLDRLARPVFAQDNPREGGGQSPTFSDAVRQEYLVAGEITRTKFTITVPPNMAGRYDVKLLVNGATIDEMQPDPDSQIPGWDDTAWKTAIDNENESSLFVWEGVDFAVASLGQEEPVTLTFAADMFLSPNQNVRLDDDLSEYRRPKVTYLVNAVKLDDVEPIELSSEEVALQFLWLGEAKTEAVRVKRSDGLVINRSEVDPAKGEHFAIFPDDEITYRFSWTNTADRTLEASELADAYAIARLTKHGDPTSDQEYYNDASSSIHPFAPHSLIWPLVDVLERSGLPPEIESGQTATFEYSVLLRQEIDAKDLSIGAQALLYEPVETQTKVASETVHDDLWMAVTGEVKTASTNDEAWPFVTLVANPDQRVYRSGEGSLKAVATPYSERAGLYRTATDRDGQYRLEFPRSERQLRNGAGDLVEPSDAEEAPMFNIALEYLDDHHGVDYTYIDNEETSSPVLLMLEPLPAPKGASTTYNVDFSAVSPGSATLFGATFERADGATRAWAGSVVMRAASLARDLLESHKDAFGVTGDTALLPDLRILGTSAGSPEDSSRFLYDARLLTVGSTDWHVTQTGGNEFREVLTWEENLEVTVYHEWGHALEDAVIWTQSAPISTPVTTLGFLKLPAQSTDDSHFGIKHDGSYYALLEGFADGVALFALRAWEEQEDWSIPRAWVESSGRRRILPLDFSKPLPSFAGEANGPNLVSGQEQASRQLFATDTEEAAFTSFMKTLMSGDQVLSGSWSWWVGGEQLRLDSTLGSNEENRFVRMLQLFRESARSGSQSDGEGIVTFPSIVQGVGNALGTGATEASEVLFKAFGLFADLDCNSIFDPGIAELTGRNGSYCPLIVRNGGYGDRTVGRRGAGDETVYGSRQWRDSLLGINQQAESASVLPSPPILEADDIPTLRTQLSDPSATGVVRVRTYIPGDVGDQLISSREISIQGSEDVPLPMPLPVLRSRVVVDVTGSSTEPVVIESTDYWRSGEATRLATQTFTLDGGTPPSVGLAPLASSVDEEPLRAGECRKVSKDLMSCAVASGGSGGGGDVAQVITLDPPTEALSEPPASLPTTITSVPGTVLVIGDGEPRDDGELYRLEPTGEPGVEPIEVTLPVGTTELAPAAQAVLETARETVAADKDERVTITLPEVTEPKDRFILPSPALIPDLPKAVVSVETAQAADSGETITLSSEPVAPGDSVTVATASFVPGETVNVLLDDTVVERDVSIPGEGAQLVVTVPDDTSSGEHVITLERTTGEQLTSGAFSVRRPISAVSWTLIGLALAGGLLWFVIRRRSNRPPSVPPVTPPTPLPVSPAVGSTLLLVASLASAISSVGVTVEASSYAPIRHTPTAREVFLPPGSTDEQVPVEYRHPHLRVADGADPNEMYATVGQVSLVARLASDWYRLYPGEHLVIAELGQPDETGGFDRMQLWTADHLGTSSVLYSPDNPELSALYNPRKACELATLTTTLVGSNELGAFAAFPAGPDGSEQSPAIPNLTYSASDTEHWTVWLSRDFQGPRVGATSLTAIRNRCSAFGEVASQ